MDAGSSRESSKGISVVYSAGVDLIAALLWPGSGQGTERGTRSALRRLLVEARRYCVGAGIGDYEEIDKVVWRLSDVSRAFLMELRREKQRLTEMLDWRLIESVLDRLLRILSIGSLHVKLVPAWFICPPAYGMWDDSLDSITCFVRPTSETRFVAGAIIHEISHLYVFRCFHSKHEGTVVALSQALEMTLFPGEKAYNRGYPPLANYMLEGMQDPREIRERVRRLLVGEVVVRSGER